MSEENVKTRFITPSLQKSGWALEQLSMEYAIKDYVFSDGKMDSKTRKRGNPKKADYALFYKGLCLAVIEAKDDIYEDSEGLEQAKGYAIMLKAPFAYSSSGKSFKECEFNSDFTGCSLQTLKLDSFPSPQNLYERFKKWQNLKNDSLFINTHYDLSNITLRYYQRNAIQETLLAAQKGKNRILLVLATGTGKTQVAYQIAHRLFNQTLPNGRKIQKILYLADRKELINTDTQRTFKSFEKGLHTIKDRDFSKTSASLYFGIYHQFISGSEENNDKKEHYKEVSKDFFDLIFIDECHRGSAREDSTWREILEYFRPALQIGMTATPKQSEEGQDNLDYFGEPVYQYSLKQGIDDGFLAPFEVLSISSNLDLSGYTPESGKTDLEGKKIPDDTFYAPDFNRKIYILPQHRFVAQEVSDFLHKTLQKPFAKTIIFCEDQRHATLIKDALSECGDIQRQLEQNHNYLARITSDDEEGKALLDDFKSILKPYPVIVTTSQLLSTGVDTQMVEVIVIDKIIRDKSLFKQIIGRGTRLNEKVESQGKTHFYVLDFKGIAREFLNDPDFMGEISYIQKTDVQPIPPRDSHKQRSNEPKQTYIIDGEEIEVLLKDKSVSYWREVEGELQLITQNLDAFSGEKLKNSKNLKSYLKVLRENNNQEREEFLAELESKGIFINELKTMECFKHCHEFDILLSLATGQKALTRKERAKKANKFLESLQPQARELITLLLDKYTQNGFSELNISIFQNEPFASNYNRSFIAKILQENGGFENLIQNLKNALYEEVS